MDLSEYLKSKNDELVKTIFSRKAAKDAKRHKLYTTSDSEAIVHLYEDFGVSMVEHLDGRYAFVVAAE